ncbi:hypothetical protein LUZ60_005654 [Juncus effusus]|nr:hypothetical protein LUZ60_005654 [Juncus effusus]
MAMKAGEKTSFALACGLLSQYMKEKGNFATLNLGKNDSYRRPITMNLLPGAEVEIETEEGNQNGAVFGSISNLNEMELFPQSAGFESCKLEAEKEKEKEIEKKEQLTIVYGGKVLVFNNFPEEKAKDLMNFASKKNSSSPPIQVPAIEAPKPTKPIFSDLPIMRKKSLQRFLEKRKDRLNSKAPYQQQQKELTKTNNYNNNQGIIGASIKKENCESDSWLSLN